jgi:hypothetical protein
VGVPQIIFGALIVVATAALGGYYAFRQWQTLQRLRADAAMDDDERQFQRNQAWRRLAGSVLLLLLAAMFVGVFFLEGPAADLVQVGEENVAQDQQRPLNDSEKTFLRIYWGYVIVLLLLVLGLIGIAGYELYAIRRYSVHHMRRIQDERRAMIARETARLRRERNGHA